MNKNFFINATLMIALPLASIAQMQFKSSEHSLTTTLKLSWEGSKDSDSASIELWERVISEHYRNLVPSKDIKPVVRQTNFRFDIDSLLFPAYFSIEVPTTISGANHEIFNNLYLANPGDEVEFDIRKDTIIFSGPSMASYQCQFELKLAHRKLSKMYFAHTGPLDSTTFISFHKARWKFESDLLAAKLNILARYERKIPSEIFGILKTDVISEHLLIVGLVYYDSITNSVDIKFKTERQKSGARDRLGKLYRSLTAVEFTGITDLHKVRSKTYCTYLLEMEKINHYEHGKTDIYAAIKARYSGTLKDQLVVCYFMEFLKTSLAAREQLSDALKNGKTDYCLDVLYSFDRSFSKGGEFRNFVLPDRNGNTVNLDQFRGKVVLLDYWFTGCSPCRLFYKNVLSKIEEKYSGNPDIIFLSISSDKNIERWKKTVDASTYTSKHSINLFTEGKGEGHPVIKNNNVFYFPYLVLLDRNGKIITTYQNDLRNYAQLDHILTSSLK